MLTAFQNKGLNMIQAAANQRSEFLQVIGISLTIPPISKSILTSNRKKVSKFVLNEILGYDIYLKSSSSHFSASLRTYTVDKVAS